jgi:hypothetical protein
MKILFQLHALLNEIQECLSSYQSREFFKVSSTAATDAEEEGRQEIQVCREEENSQNGYEEKEGEEA